MDDTTTTHAERRKSERKALRSNAFLILPGHQPITVRTLDLSRQGVSIVADINLPKNICCTVQFDIPKKPTGSTKAVLQATVGQSILCGSDGGFRIGLHFSSATAEVAGAIKRFLSD